MRRLIGIALILVGCGSHTSKPKVIDGTQLGKDLAANKVAASATIFRQAYRDAANELLQCQCYPELDRLLQELDSMDPVETLATPSSLVWRMHEMKTYVGDFPWLCYYAREWRKSTHGPYSQFALVTGYISHGTILMYGEADPTNPLCQQAASYYHDGVVAATLVKESQPSGPSCMVLSDTPGWDPAITLTQITKHPNDIGLYEILQYLLAHNNYQNTKNALKSLAKASPSNYALYYTVQLPGNTARNNIKRGWEWEPLDLGFQSLLKAHPNALGVRNAYAVAAAQFEKREIQREQLAQLGYLVDFTYWGGVDLYQRDLGDLPDCRQGDSSLKPLALGEQLRKQSTSDLSRLQSNEMFRKQIWTALESDLAALNPGELYQSEAALQQAKGGTAGYKQREKQLKEWKEARPDCLAATANLGGFYVRYGWLARGDGTAGSVSEQGWKLFHERLKIARDLLFQAYGANYQSASTMANLMTIYNAETNNPESAQNLAVQAARKGLVGFPALDAYATMLLPRWQGQPGDIPKACDFLRKKTGNDDAYAIMLATVVKYEGWDIVDPNHPMHMDWKRALNSLIEGEKAHRLPGGLAAYYLYLANYAEWRKDGARILPYVPTQGQPPDPDDASIVYSARRAWAEGRAESAFFEPRMTYKLLGPRRQKAGRAARLGFTVHLDKAFATGHHYVVEVECPLTTSEGGHPYSSYSLVADFDPMTQREMVISAWPRPDGYPAGTYKISLTNKDMKDNTTVIHSETFELTP